jgi:type II secretion system protein I
VEVLVSVAILAIGTVVVLQALARTAQAQALAEDRAQAHLIMRSTITEAELAWLGGAAMSDHESGRVQRGAQQFEWLLSTTLTDDPEVHAVVLTVSWQRGVQTYTEELSALVRVPERSP